jgi:hypothetical protein
LEEISMHSMLNIVKELKESLSNLRMLYSIQMNHKDSTLIMKLDRDFTQMNQDAIKVFTCPQLLQPVTSNVKVEIAS